MEALHSAVLILHIFGAIIIICVSFATLVMELKKYNSKKMLAWTEHLWKFAGIAMGTQLLTGLYLAGSEWDQISQIPYFWIKLVLFFVIGGVVRTMNKRHFEKLKAGKKDAGGSKWSLIGFLVIITIAALGVMIAENAS